MILVNYRGHAPNFGDDLNDVLWRALDPALLDEDPTEALVGIGTIIGKACAPGARLHVFSSGAGNDPVDRWKHRDVRYWCVRGPLTCRLLGLPPETAITDGALLVPAAPGFPRAASGGEGVLVVPHFQTIEYPGWKEACDAAGFELVDPRGTPAQVIARLAGARLVLTESLHGAIIADAYGIPWNVFATSGNFGSTKFFDWCESLGLACRFTYLPPPNALQLLEQGKGGCRWGKVETVSFESAMSALGTRLAPERKPGLKGWVKSQIHTHGFLHRRLGYSPPRTAAALTALAADPPSLSALHVRAYAQERLLASFERLRQFKNERAAA